jgi:hypothetical protein
MGRKTSSDAPRLRGDRDAIAKPGDSHASALRVRLRGGHEPFGNAKVPNDELVDFQSSDSGATDGQPTDGKSADGHGTDRDCTQGQRAKCLRSAPRRSNFASTRSAGFQGQVAGERLFHRVATRKVMRWYSQHGCVSALGSAARPSAAGGRRTRPRKGCGGAHPEAWRELPDEQALRFGKTMPIGLMRCGRVESKTLEQTNRSLVFGFDSGQVPIDTIGFCQVLEHGLRCRARIPSAPVPAGQYKRNPRTAGRDDCGLHKADRRLTRRTNHPIEPALAAVRRGARLEPRIDAAKVFDGGRRWMVEVAMNVRIGENLEHGLRMRRGQRLEHKLPGGECLHAPCGWSSVAAAAGSP